MNGLAIRIASATVLSCAIALGSSAAQSPTTSPASLPPTPPPTTAGQSISPPATTPVSAPQGVPGGRVFGADAGIIFNQIKPEKTTDFEAVMLRLKDALLKSTDPVRKRQATGWRVYRSVEPGPNGGVLYLFVMNPAVKGADYTVSKILAETLPAEAQALYKQFSESYAGGQSLVNLQLVQDFAPPIAPAVGQDH